MKKIFFALLMTILLVTAITILDLGVISYAEEVELASTVASGSCGDNLSWTLDSEGTLTISGTGAMTVWNSNISVVWRPYIESIKRVVIEDGVTDISRLAFTGCINLESVEIANNVVSIGEYAFNNCTNITEINIPDSVTSIGKGAFAGCTNLKSVEIGNSVVSIGEYAFNNCTNITGINIPDSVTSIGKGAFHNCEKLKSITVDEKNFYYSSDKDGVLFDKNKTSIIQFPAGKSPTSYIIQKSIKNIEYAAFYNCYRLTTVYYTGTQDEWNQIVIGSDNAPILNAKVKYISDTSSGSCGDNLAWVLDDEGTLTISGTGAMTVWNSSISIPWLPYLKSIKSVVIEDGVTDIGRYAFFGCESLANVNISNSVETIGNSAFNGCKNLESITISYGVKSIGWGVFNDCSQLKSITVDENNPYYSSDENGVLFNKDKTILIKYPEGKEETSYIIPDSVINVDSNAFENCSTLFSITIGKNVEEFSLSAIDYCSSLQNIMVDKNNSYYSSDEYGVLFNKDKTTLLRCPEGKTGTSYYIPNGVKIIGKYAFYECQGLENIIIPDSITNIESTAFSYCNKLESIVIPDSVTSIGQNSFSYCTNLTSVTVGNNITNIPDFAFSACTNIKSATIGTKVEKIGAYAFNLCYNLSNIIIPNSVTSIGEGAFHYCRSLSAVNYMGTQAEWNKISIDNSNDPLRGANKIFLLEKGSVPFEGAQIRTEGEQGLRYIFKIPKVLSENCLEFGSVVMPKKYLGDEALEIGLVTNVNGKNYAAKKIPALKIFGEDDEYIYYTVCITKIKESNYSSEYVAVPYVITKNADGSERITYGEEQSMTVNEVMSALSE